MSSKKVIEIVDFHEPGYRKPGEKRERMESSQLASIPQRLGNPRKLLKTDELSRRNIWASVAELGASGFEGSQKKKWEGSRLASVGGVVTGKSQRMPFKMYLGVSKARREREAKVEEEARQSGIVRPKKQKKMRKVEKKGGRDGFDEPVPHNIRGSIMFAGSS